MSKEKISRRDFLKSSAMAGIGLTVLPNFVFGRQFGSHTPPSDKLNIAGIGVGGKGWANLNAMATENIVALCDVDWNYSRGVFDAYPNAKRYKDWRLMFDEMGDTIDAVMVATADHTHAICAASAMTLGKHVFCQKPLTHSVYESRLLTALAKKHRVATQMGNQGCSSPEVAQICEWIWNGEIGEVKEVQAWTNRPLWPQGINKPEQGMWVPDTLDWDGFLGPAAARPYHEIYTPWGWRGWWDFGTGGLGDMACHILDPVFKALKLKYPTAVEASSTLFNLDSAPRAEVVEFTYPERKNPGKEVKVKMPEVRVTWSDGGILPRRPKKLPDGESLIKDTMGGCMFIGSKDTLICDTAGIDPRLLSGRVPNVSPTLRRVAGYKPGGLDDFPHAQDWIRACKESPDSRVEAISHFGYSGPFNEMIVMGVLAVRLQSLNRELLWDGENMRFTNINDHDQLQVVISDDYHIEKGHPHFDTKYATLDARPTAEEYIRHTYRDGWSLPPMPKQ